MTKSKYRVKIYLHKTTVESLKEKIGKCILRVEYNLGTIALVLEECKKEARKLGCIEGDILDIKINSGSEWRIKT